MFDNLDERIRSVANDCGLVFTQSSTVFKAMEKSQKEIGIKQTVEILGICKELITVGKSREIFGQPESSEEFCAEALESSILKTIAQVRSKTNSLQHFEKVEKRYLNWLKILKEDGKTLEYIPAD